MSKTAMPNGLVNLNRRIFHNTGLVSDCPCVRKPRSAIEQRLRSQLNSMRIRRVEQRFLKRTLLEFKAVLQAKKVGGNLLMPRTNLAVDLAEYLGIYEQKPQNTKDLWLPYFFIARLILWFNVRVQRLRPDLAKETTELQHFLTQK